MDYFYKTYEAAQKQAQSLSLQVSQSAKGLGEQLSTHTKTLAEQAASASSSAAEQAGQRWKELNIQETLQLKAFQSSPPTAEAGPSEEDLKRFGITLSLQEFVRSLTYSTFRDFPLDQIPAAAAQEDPEKKALTPWQEKHALLIVQQVKEINELRFVLCPKRMNDTQFWSVYFLLAKKYLPSEAFDPDFKLEDQPAEKDPKQTLFDIQTGLKRTLDTARETAKNLATRAQGALQPVDASESLHEMVASHRDSDVRPPSNGHKSGTPSQPPQAEPDLDHDLEAYLRTMSEDKAEEGEEESVESEVAADLDDYLNELGEANSDEEEAGSDEYLHIAEQAAKGSENEHES